ncbi:MAG: T9SS type A sorting domain-containing protein, partial [Ignavibacteria bacterium]
YDEFIKLRMTDAKTAVGSIYVQDAASINQIFSGNRSYAKGCVVLHMLRGIVGDSAYFNIIRAYASDASIIYKTAVTEDFQNAAETVSGQNLDYFFNEWIYGENYPKYNVSWIVEDLTNGRYKASITITQNANTNPAYFTMPVQIKIFTQTGDTLVNVFNAAMSETFDFILESKPTDFEIDPDDLILKEIHGGNAVPVNFILGQNYPNPFNPVTNISYQLGKPSSVKLIVYDILGQEVALLKNEKQREGNYTVEFTGQSLASGIYFYKLEALDFENLTLLYEDTKKMILVK